MEQNKRDDLEFFLADMPGTRPADIYLGCFDGSIFMDFNRKDGLIYLVRISFDGYGCCDLKDLAMPLHEVDSQAFKEIIEGSLSDQSRLTTIVRKTILANKKLIWEDALKEYGLS